MVFRFLICRYVHLQLDAFLDSRLSPRVRRRVVRHIDTCPACYQAYARQRDLRRDLQATVPLVGRGAAPDFDRMWSAIRTELPRPQPRQTQFRYGLVMLLLVMALIVPLTMGNHDLTRTVPEHPMPQTEASTQTPDRITEPDIIVTLTSSPAQQTPPTLPEPDFSR